MAMGQTFVIVGASLAGAKAAETLRSEGFDGRVVLIGEEPVRPYERPPLSKAYLRGEVDFDSAAVHPRGVLRGPRHRAAHLDHGHVDRSRRHDGSKWTLAERSPTTSCSSPPAPPRDG